MAEESESCADELAGLSLMLLSWALERQDEPATKERTRALVNEAAADRMHSVAADLLTVADKHLGEPLSTEQIRSKFQSLVARGCRQSGDGEEPAYVEITAHSKCIMKAGYGNHCYTKAGPYTDEDGNRVGGLRMAAG